MGAPSIPPPIINRTTLARVGGAVVRNPHHIGSVGDSRNADVYANSIKTLKGANSWFNQANALLGQRMIMTVHLAVSGQRSDQFLSDANIDALIASDIKYALIGGITNDVAYNFAAGEPFPSFYVPKLNRLIAAGIVPVLQTEPGSTAYAASATGRGRIQKHNAQVKAFALSKPYGQVLVLDFAPYILDPTSTGNIVFKAGYLPDGTHNAVPAASVAGRLFADLMRDKIPARPARRVMANELPAQGIQMLSNPGFSVGTAGTVGSGFSGQVPTGFNATCDANITCVSSIVAAADGRKGWKWVITANAGGRVRGVFDIPAGENPNDVFDAFVNVDVATGCTGLTSPILLSDVNRNPGGGAVSTPYGDLYADDQTDYGVMLGDRAESLSLHTPVTITNGTRGWWNYELRAKFKTAGAAEITWWDNAMDKRQTW